MVEMRSPPYATSRPLKVFVALLVWRMLPPVIVSPEADEKPPADETLIPPANVEVAVLDALMDPPIRRSLPTLRRLENVEEAFAIMFCARRVEEACKGRLETRSPDVNVEEALEMREVPAARVRMPEEYVSSASDLRKEPESIESKVVASVQLEVTATSLALIVMHVPAPTARAPAVVVSPPPSRALKEPEAKLIFPPEIVSPEADEMPPEVETLIPPANVDVAVEEELIPAPACRSPATLRRFANVELAFAIMFCARRVEEACKGALAATINPCEKVDEAVASSPPD